MWNYGRLLCLQVAWRLADPNFIPVTVSIKLKGGQNKWESIYCYGK